MILSRQGANSAEAIKPGAVGGKPRRLAKIKEGES